MYMKFKKFQRLIIFSDGSMQLSSNFENKKIKIIKNLNNDLKSFQKLTKLNALNSLTNLNNVNLTSNFRKNLFR